VDAKVITNVGQLMSSTTEERLIFLGQTISDAYWEIGRIVNATINDAQLSGAEIQVMQVYSHAAKLTGKSARTVRHYAAVAEFYPPVAQEEYDVLRFAHFAFAQRFPDRWRELLDAAIRHMDSTGGKLPSVDWLAVNFTGASQLTAQLDDVEEMAAVEDIIHGPLTEDPWADGEPAVDSPDAPVNDGFIVGNVARVLDYLRRQGEKLPVSEETRERWLTVCDAFVSVLAEIRREMAEKRDN